ncbi:MAG: hypothetical protein KGH72_03190 [Candidatus Micrarchaeota archaeon]|nr:hypothetical protein [Candidatus Micrarchaeota archaeon]
MTRLSVETLEALSYGGSFEEQHAILANPEATKRLPEAELKRLIREYPCVALRNPLTVGMLSTVKLMEMARDAQFPDLAAEAALALQTRLAARDLGTAASAG